VAAAAIGGIPELINDDVGALFAPGDSADLARKLAALVSDTDRLRRMGEAARRKVTRDHDPDDHLQRLLDVYRHASGETSEAALQGET
jgi:glycosyltransferase involved in cell wall biosynthesis